METILKAMDEMESACESETALLSMRLPDIAQLVSGIKSLPRDQQLEMRDRLQRIQIIMEGQMLLYATETEHLREVIRAARLPKPKVAKEDGEVAFIRISPSILDSAPTTLQ